MLVYNEFRGDAQPRRQVVHVVPINVEPGDVLRLTINRKDIEIDTGTFEEGTVAVTTIVQVFVSAVNNSTIPEWQEITATEGQDDEGITTHLVLTGPADGTPFTVETSTNDAGQFGVDVETIQDGEPDVNEKQRFSLAGPPTGGTYTLTFDGQTTGNIAYNASAATVQTELEGLSNIAPGDVIVTENSGGIQRTVEFTGVYAGVDVPLLFGDGANLTGGSRVSVHTEQDGNTGQNSIWEITPSFGSFGTFQISLVVNHENGTNFETTFRSQFISTSASASFVQTAIQNTVLATPGGGTVGAGQCSVSGPNGGPWLVEFTGRYAGKTVIMSFFSSADGEEIQEGSGVGQNEIQKITVANQPSSGTWTATFSGQTTAAQAFNESAANLQTDLEALSTIGAGNISVARSGSGTLADPYIYACTFQGTLAQTDVAQMTATSSLVGSAISLATTQAADEGQNEQQEITLNNGPTGGTFTLTYSGQTTAPIAFDASDAAVEAALVALSNIGVGDVDVVGPDGGPWVVEFQTLLARTNVSEMTGDASGLTGAGTQTFVATVATEPTGPHYWDEPENWTLNHIPVSGEVIVIDGAVSIKFGLTHPDVEPARIHIRSTFTGELGLSTWNTAGYREYRDLYLRIANGESETPLEIIVGEGDGAGSSLIRLDTGYAQVKLEVRNSAQVSDGSRPAVLWKGIHSVGTNDGGTGGDGGNTEIDIKKGSLGIAFEAGEVATLEQLRISHSGNVETDASVVLGADVSIATIYKTGGVLLAHCGIEVWLEQYDGITTIDGFGAVESIQGYGGDIYYNTIGVLDGAAVLSGDCKLIFDQDVRVKTVANPINVYGDVADVVATAAQLNGVIVNYHHTTRNANWGRGHRITFGTP